MFRSFKQISTHRRLDPEFWLVWKLVIATLPVVIAGYLMNTYFENALRSVEVIGWTTLGFGILLFLADKLTRHRYSLSLSISSKLQEIKSKIPVGHAAAGVDAAPSGEGEVGDAKRPVGGRMKAE